MWLPGKENSASGATVAEKREGKGETIEEGQEERKNGSNWFSLKSSLGPRNSVACPGRWNGHAYLEGDRLFLVRLTRANNNKWPLATEEAQ